MRRTIAFVLSVGVFLGWQEWRNLSVGAGDDGGAAAPCATLNGDVNGDGGIDITDAIGILERLFLGGAPLVPFCDAGGGGLTAEQEAVPLPLADEPERLLGVLREWHDSSREGATTTEATPLTDSEREELRALGYIE